MGTLVGVVVAVLVGTGVSVGGASVGVAEGARVGGCVGDGGTSVWVGSAESAAGVGETACFTACSPGIDWQPARAADARKTSQAAIASRFTPWPNTLSMR